jgi:hypothetical protein
MIKNITVVNYIDMASRSLLELVNLLISSENKFIDIHNREYQKFFFMDLNKRLESYKTLGQKVIVINACYSKNNWKSGLKQFKNKKLSPQKYEFPNKELKMSLNKLSNLLDKYWLYLKGNSKFITIETKEADTIDLYQAIKEYISTDFLNIIQPKFTLLIDKSVFEYYSKLKTRYKVPPFIKEKVSNKLSKNGVI